MKVTVVTACHNAAKTIASTLRSVQLQRNVLVEHIVVDGGSNDGTLEVLARVADGVKIIPGPDRGLYDAMNKGIEAASGDLVGFLNADDRLADEHCLERLVGQVCAAGADGAYGDLLYLGGPTGNDVVRHWRSGQFHVSRLKRGWMPPHPTLYLRREVFAQIGGFDLRYRIASDYDFMLRLLMRDRYRIEYLPQVLVHMSTGGVSNGSMRGIILKMAEDLSIAKSHGLGGLDVLACKNLRKIPQLRLAGLQSVNGSLTTGGLRALQTDAEPAGPVGDAAAARSQIPGPMTGQPVLASQQKSSGMQPLP